MKIRGQSRTLACLGFSYVTKIAAVAVLLFAVGELVNAADMWIESRR